MSLSIQHLRTTPLRYNVQRDSEFLDLGCNTGFFLKELVKAKNVKATGVDVKQELINICEKTFKYDRVEAEFICSDFQPFIDNCILTGVQYDNVAMLSVFDFDTTVEHMLERLLAITRHKLFLEPTNHTKETTEQILERLKCRPFKNLNVKVLGTTDYQNRILFMVTKNA